MQAKFIQMLFQMRQEHLQLFAVLEETKNNVQNLKITNSASSLIIKRKHVSLMQRLLTCGSWPNSGP